MFTEQQQQQRYTIIILLYCAQKHLYGITINNAHNILL